MDGKVVEQNQLPLYQRNSYLLPKNSGPIMEELYLVVKVRIETIRLLHSNFGNNNNVLPAGEFRKYREEERLRIEKENWILSVFRTLKTFSPDQKQALFWKSAAIMKSIWFEFKSISCEEAITSSAEEMTSRFFERFVKLYADFFLPLECIFQFRVSMRHIVKPNSLTVVPDLLKYLIEFSRDYFKNFISNLSQKMLGEKEAPIQGSILKEQFISSNMVLSKNYKSNSDILEEGTFPTTNENEEDLNNMFQSTNINSSSPQNQKKQKQSEVIIKCRSKSQASALEEGDQYCLTETYCNSSRQQQIQPQTQSQQQQQQQQLIKKNDQQSSPIKYCPKPKIFPSSIQIKWYSRQEQNEYFQGSKQGWSAYEGLCELESPCLGVVIEGKLRRSKGELGELKNISESIYDSSRLRNIQVQLTISSYYEKYKQKYTSEVRLFERDTLINSDKQRKEQDKLSRQFLTYYYQIVFPDSTSTTNKSQQMQQKLLPIYSNKGSSPTKNSNSNNSFINSQMKILKPNSFKLPQGIMFPPKQIHLVPSVGPPLVTEESTNLQHSSQVSKKMIILPSSNLQSKDSYDFSNVQNSPTLKLSTPAFIYPQSTAVSAALSQRISIEEIKNDKNQKKREIHSQFLFKLNQNESFIQQQVSIRNNRIVRPPSCSPRQNKNKRKETEQKSNSPQQRKDQQDTSFTDVREQWISQAEVYKPISFAKDQGNDNQLRFKNSRKRCKGISDLRSNSQNDPKQKQSEDFTAEKNEGLEKEVVDYSDLSVPHERIKVHSAWQNWWATKKRQENRSKSVFQSFPENSSQNKNKESGQQLPPPIQQQQMFNKQDCSPSSQIIETIQTQKFAQQLTQQSHIQSVLKQQLAFNYQTEEKLIAATNKQKRPAIASRGHKRVSSQGQIVTHSNLYSKPKLPNRVNLSQICESQNGNNNSKNPNNKNMNSNLISSTNLSNNNNCNMPNFNSQQLLPSDFYLSAEQNCTSSQNQSQKIMNSLTTRSKKEDTLKNFLQNRLSKEAVDSSKSYVNTVPSTDQTQKIRHKDQKGINSFAIILMKQRQSGNFSAKGPPQNLPTPINGKSISQCFQ